jgi:pre-mRNA-splicing factor ISY1
LPGVKELFESRKKEEDEENATHTFYKKFTNQGPAYFGDVDEADGELLKYEEVAEQEGTFVTFRWQAVHQIAGRVGRGACTPSRNAWPSLR